MNNNNIDNGAINPSIGNKKTQVFNLIIGIATLLIALLGATFAYFTATARSEQGEVMVKSAMVSINFDRGTAIKANNLIPSSEKVALSKYYKEATVYEGTDYIQEYEEYMLTNPTDLSDYYDRRCIDAKGKEVCYVFWFSVKSDGSIDESTDILSYITVDNNEFENLSYLVYEVEYERDENGKILNDKYGFGIVKKYTLVSEFQADSSLSIAEDDQSWAEFSPFGRFGKVQNVFEDENLVGTVSPIACLWGEKDDVSELAIDDTSRCKLYNISNQEEHNYQIVIWLEETGYEQLEQGKVFSGTVSVEVNGDTGAVGYEGGKITGTE